MGLRMPLPMLRRLLIPALATCFSLPVFGQTPNQLYTATRLQLDVTKVLLQQENAWNKGDLDSYISHYKDAADTQAILAGPTRGLANIRSAFHVSYPNRDSMGQLQQTEIEVRALGEDHALAVGKYHLQRSRKSGGDTDGMFVEVLEKTGNVWQVVFSETV